MKIKLIILTLVCATFFTANQYLAPKAAVSNAGVIKVTIFYPNGEGKTFDMDYYKDRHMPMVAELLGDSLQGYSIDQGLSGRSPEEPVPYLAVGYLHFHQLSDYQNSFGPVAEKILSDIPNYTNIQPVVQISKVIK